MKCYKGKYTEMYMCFGYLLPPYHINKHYLEKYLREKTDKVKICALG
jgi:hypothetical protein